MSDDFCEYVYNPLMRQYQAMMRLMQMLRSSQASDCNDIQCFTSEDDPFSSLSPAQPSFFMTYVPMLIVWAMFAFALFMFRPNSLRKPANNAKKNPSNLPHNTLPNRFNNDDDDDNSTVS